VLTTITYITSHDPEILLNQHYRVTYDKCPYRKNMINGLLHTRCLDSGVTVIKSQRLMYKLQLTQSLVDKLSTIYDHDKL